jgi:hypothetical protein
MSANLKLKSDVLKVVKVIGSSDWFIQGAQLKPKNLNQIIFMEGFIYFLNICMLPDTRGIKSFVGL